ncbi:MAG: hypothetical protein HN849_34030 [Victivallales bacterium]|jgi:hypothetical protein|nr:hypothetical protein [Victivallales bacterium]
MKNRRTIGTLLFLFCCIPATAQANAGSVLMISGYLHLTVGNFLIGLVEGGLLVWLFGARWPRAGKTMLVSNYLSAWSGGWILRRFMLLTFPPDLYSARRFFWTGIVVAYLFTLLVEYPFVAYCLGKGRRSFRVVLKASLVVQTITYVALFGWYWTVSPRSLYTEARAVPPSEISFPAGLRLYYISADDGDVYRQALGENVSEHVFRLSSNWRNDRLFMRAAPGEDGQWDLMALLEPGLEQGSRSVVPVADDVAAGVGVGERDEEGIPQNPWGDARAMHLGDAESSDWEFRCGYWVAYSLVGTNERTGQHTWIRYETVFGHWYIGNATHLPGDLVVFQLGRDQICVWDVKQRKVALLARGRGPVVVVPRGTESPTSKPE